MYHDWFSHLNDLDENSINISLAKRQKAALTVFKPDVNKENKNRAKEKSGKFTLEKYDYLPYISPGDIEPPFSRSIAVKLKWKLATPFHSRSESFFEPLDNPIVRDKFNNSCSLRSTGLKGMLRSILEMKNPVIAELLFGKKSDNLEMGSAGRIVMGDVFFENKHIMDVFSPHDRQKRVANLPVSFEVVPKDSTGELGFFIFEINKGELDFKNCLILIFESLSELLLIYGLSAKRSLDYGIAKKNSIKITVKPGSSIKIPDDSKFLVKEMAIYNVPEPKLPEFFNLDEEKKSLLLPDGSLCEREKAWEFVYNYRIKKEGKTNEKRRAQIEEKSKKAGPRLWDELNELFSKNQGYDKENIIQKQKEHEEWLKRKKEYEEKNSIIKWEFNSFEEATKEMERVVIQ